MAFRKREAQQFVIGISQQLNLRVLKLLAFEAISAIKLKPDNKPIPEKTAYQWLYDNWFGENEISNTGHFINILADDYERNALDLQTVAERLRLFHLELARRISINDPAKDLIESL